MAEPNVNELLLRILFYCTPRMQTTSDVWKQDVTALHAQCIKGNLPDDYAEAFLMPIVRALGMQDDQHLAECGVTVEAVCERIAELTTANDALEADVTSCQRINTEMVGELKRHLAKVKALEAERDALQAAVRKAKKYIKRTTPFPIYDARSRAIMCILDTVLKG